MPRSKSRCIVGGRFQHSGREPCTVPMAESQYLAKSWSFDRGDSLVPGVFFLDIKDSIHRL